MLLHIQIPFILFNLTGSKDGYFEFFLPTAQYVAKLLAPNISVNNFLIAILHPPALSCKIMLITADLLSFSVA